MIAVKVAERRLRLGDQVDLAETDRVEPGLPRGEDRRQVRLDVGQLLRELADRCRQCPSGDDDEDDQDGHNRAIDEDRRDRSWQTRDDVDDRGDDRADDEARSQARKNVRKMSPK
jgi:hypothetical protein